MIEVIRESNKPVFTECSLWARHLSPHFIFTELYNFRNEETGLLEYNRPKIHQRERHSPFITWALSKQATLKPNSMKTETQCSPFSPHLDFARLCFIIIVCITFLLNRKFTEDRDCVTPLYSSQGWKLGYTHIHTHKCSGKETC